jgi:kanamycin kinase
MFYDPLDGPISLPSALERVIGGREYEAVWVNLVGGITFKVNDEPRSLYVKWSPITSGINLRDEKDRLEWSATYTPVPDVVDFGENDEGTWLVTSAIDGLNAAAPEWNRQPAIATAAVGRGFRDLHRSIPIEDCPYRWSIEDRLRSVHERIESGELTHIEPSDWNEEFSSMSVEAALRELSDAPDLDLVVCHGDACVPNTLLDANGAWTAHVDLGSLGVADRWADLAVASWSTVWNYGPGWENTLFDAYEILPNPEKNRYYRLLWELG